MDLNPSHTITDALPDPRGAHHPSLGKRETEQAADARLVGPDELDKPDQSDESDNIHKSDDSGEYQPLRTRTVEAQVSAAAAWSRDRDQLCEFIGIITDAFRERELFQVAGLCKELRRSDKLPPMQRAHIEAWMSFMPGEDAGERLDEAERWFEHVKRSVAPYCLGGPPREVVEGLEMVGTLRKHLVTVDTDGAEQDKRPRPVDILTPTPASKLTSEQIGPAIPLDEKLRWLDQWARFNRESEEERLEELSTAGNVAEGKESAAVLPVDILYDPHGPSRTGAGRLQLATTSSSVAAEIRQSMHDSSLPPAPADGESAAGASAAGESAAEGSVAEDLPVAMD